jgi:hypothetical protein
VSAPLLLRPQPREALDELANRRRLGRPGETRRESVLAPDHGVLTAWVVGPLEAFEGDLEVGNCARKHERFTGDNPASGFVWLRPYNDQEEGFFTWEDEHLEAYMARHPIGSRARMAFALMYYAGVRKSDAFQLGPLHVKARGSELHWTEWKGSRSTALGKHRPPAEASSARNPS